MVRGVAVARREVHEERLVRSDRVLHMDPIDGAISHVADQDIVRVVIRRGTSFVFSNNAGCQLSVSPPRNP